jgi:hypothetical protein
VVVEVEVNQVQQVVEALVEVERVLQDQVVELLQQEQQTLAVVVAVVDQIQLVQQ